MIVISLIKSARENTSIWRWFIAATFRPLERLQCCRVRTGSYYGRNAEADVQGEPNDNDRRR